MGNRNGSDIRPFHVCGELVNFVFWAEESARRRSNKIWHWANPDGSHHVHGNGKKKFGRHESYADEYPQQQLDHLNEILRGDA